MGIRCGIRRQRVYENLKGKKKNGENNAKFTL